MRKPRWNVWAECNSGRMFGVIFRGYTLPFSEKRTTPTVGTERRVSNRFFMKRPKHNEGTKAREHFERASKED